MMKTLLFIVCLLGLASCSYHAYTKAEAIRFVKKRDVKKDGRIVIEDEGTVLKCLVRDERFQKLDNIYEFDETGKQIKYSVVAYCDSCFQKYLLKEVNSKVYQWQPLNDTTYISKYACKRYLKVHPSTFSYDIVLHSLSRNVYNELIKR